MHLLPLFLAATSAIALNLPSRLANQAAPNLNDRTAEAEAPPNLDTFLSDYLPDRRLRPRQYAQPKATIKVCTAPHFAGQCYDATWPVNTCIDLRGYAGITQSFSVQDGFECLIMQAKCDASDNYIEIGDSGYQKSVGEDLTKFGWIKDAASYMCFTELDDLKRFVSRAKAARLPTAE